MESNSQSLFDLVAWLAVGQSAMEVVLVGAKGLLAAMGVIGIGLVGAGATILGGHRRTAEAFGRTAVAWVLLENYEYIFHTVVQAADHFATWIMDHGNLMDHIQRTRENLATLWADGEEGEAGVLDRISGVLKSGMLGYSAIFTQFISLLGAQLIIFLTAVFLNILYVLGPLLVAGGVMTSGQSLKSWASSLFEISLWPAFPAVVGLMGSHMTDNPAISAGNVVVVITTNLLMSFLIILTPIVVHMLVSRGGVGLLAVAGNIVAMRAAWGLAMRMRSSVGGGVKPGGASDSGTQAMVCTSSPSDSLRPTSYPGGPSGGGPRRLYGPQSMAPGTSQNSTIIDAEWHEVRNLPPGQGPRLLGARGKDATV